MDLKSQREKAVVFRKLHDAPPLLVLPNAWDVASALVIAEAGSKAIATTSAGMAYALGYPDGERIGRDEMLATVARIAARVKLPVTADIEGGYGETPEAVAETVRQVIRVGVVGINIEDSVKARRSSLLEPSEAADRIRAACEAAESEGVPLVINARTDVFLFGIGEPESRLDAAVARANAYRAAGAGCLFVPGVCDAETIGVLAAAIDGPLNILAGTGCPRVSELEALGVARLSVGSGISRATLGLIRRATEELLSTGTYETFLKRAPSYADINALMKR